MPRKGRILVPNMPHHIVQRGHNRKAVFVEDYDYQYYLENLAEWSTEYGVKVHSYCLMTNHVHLILEPGDDTCCLSQLMKRLAGRQTRHVNRLERRSGSLWEGRYKTSPIDRENYLLQCCRYVELNPVKARMVMRPEDYKWSSFRYRIGVQNLDWMGDDNVLGMFELSKSASISRYIEFVNLKHGDQDFIQKATDRNQLIGDSAFIDEVELRVGLRIEMRGPGRPKTVKNVNGQKA